jgi:hypothetical protein
MGHVVLTLSEEEAHALERALDNYLPELRYELARVKLERDRADLVELDEMLERLRDRLATVQVSGQ